MITGLTLKNFKSIENETYSFTNFDLLVGMNNSGKSTILQALAIWQYCVDEFERNDRKGNRGIQIVLPNFTALPLPEFNLLWRNKTDRQYPKDKGIKKQEFILIEIIVYWKTNDGKEVSFGVSLRYNSPQVVYAVPGGGFDHFRKVHKGNDFPRLVYVPPFSGLEPFEEWRDDSIIKKQVGKAQPGSVLRNLLYRVVEKNKENWKVIVRQINDLFSVDLEEPEYKKGVDTQIRCSYKQNKKTFDIIVGGSGFHQTATLLAFMYGYEGVTTILLDEPDAHMHANLQRTITTFLKKQSRKESIQFIIATHSEELINGVSTADIISLLNSKPTRVMETPRILAALSDVSNIEITRTKESPYILYVEGDTDERIINTWAQTLGKTDILKRFFIRTMGGGTKETMKNSSQKHFEGLRQIVPEVKRFLLFDYDTDESLHPNKDSDYLYEWQRKNIENYYLVPDVWVRTLNACGLIPFLISKAQAVVEDFFVSQNLTLPKNQDWKTVKADIFKQVDGKKILFVSEDSLYQQLRQLDESIVLNKEALAASMLESEIHKDIDDFFEKLEALVNLDDTH